ncbi:7049_t:CDS:2, partial [Scutellospora calospora]
EEYDYEKNKNEEDNDKNIDDNNDESGDQNLKGKLLLLLIPTLQVLNNDIKDSKSLLKIEASLPSSFLVKIALKIVKTDLNKLTGKDYKFTSKKVTAIGEKIGKKILLSYSEIKL